MKKLLFLSVVACLILAGSVTAQSRFTPQERLQNLKERLNLTQEQSAEVEKILTASDKKIQELRESNNSDRTKFREIMDNSNKEIIKVLNDKQKTEFNKMLEERRSRWQKRPTGREK